MPPPPLALLTPPAMGLVSAAPGCTSLHHHGQMWNERCNIEGAAHGASGIPVQKSHQWQYGCSVTTPFHLPPYARVRRAVLRDTTGMTRRRCRSCFGA